MNISIGSIYLVSHLTFRLCLLLIRVDPVPLVDYIIQHCLFPRALLSPMDADFSAQFIKQMHLLGTPNFSTAHCYDRLIGDHIGNVVFSLSQAEARNYGEWPSQRFRLIH